MRTHAINISCILICFVVCQFSWTDDVPTIPVNLNSPVDEDGVIPIVINNTGAWHGACVAIRDFELETWENYWQQTDANHQILKFKNTVNIFEDWYNPIITNTGRNKIIVLYQMFDGSIRRGDAEFDTYHLVKEVQSDRLVLNERILQYDLIPATAGVAFPANGYISAEKHLNIEEYKFLAEIGNNTNILGYFFSMASINSSVISLYPGASHIFSTISVATSFIGFFFDSVSRIIHTNNNIDIYYKHSQYIPENERPSTDQFYILTAYISKQIHERRALIYDDLDWNGFVEDRHEIIVSLPYEILEVPQYNFLVFPPKEQ